MVRTLSLVGCVILLFLGNVCTFQLFFAPNLKRAAAAAATTVSLCMIRTRDALALDALEEAQGKATATINQKLWVDRSGSCSEKPLLSSSQLKVVTYNVLGPMHGEGSKHEYAPVSVTKWTRRRDKIMQELRSMDADILCLQEVSKKGLKESFIPGLRHVGLECCGYSQTRPDSSGGQGKLGHKNIGCAIFSKSSKVTLLSSKRVHLREFAPLTNCKSHNFVIEVKSKWNSLVMAELRIEATGRTLIVANTHLYWNPVRPDIKAIQTAAAVAAISKYTRELGYANDTMPPLIFCGDFNSMPNTKIDGVGVVDSAPHVLLSSGSLPSSHPQHPDSWSLYMGEQHCCPEIGDFTSQWKLSNAYCVPEFVSQQPFFTSKTDEFAGWIDHIWTNSELTVDSVLKPPVTSLNAEAASRFRPIPNQNFPSDHIPLGIIASVL